MFKRGFVFACLVLCACGGGSTEVPDDKRLVDLSASEIESLCEYLVSISRTVDCQGDQVTVGSDSQDECVATFEGSQTDSPNCPITVAQYETCTEDLVARSDSEVCDGSLPPSCAALFTPECIGAI